MISTDTPMYQSKPTLKSLGNSYHIYNDRIELQCSFLLFLKPLVINRDDLVSIEIFKPPVIRSALWALKLDLADLYEHVGIRRTKGFFKQLRFTPENPEEFVATVKELYRLTTRELP